MWTLWLAMAGCTQKDTADTTDSAPESVTVPPEELEVTVMWTDDGLTPTDTDDDGEPDAGCGDAVQIDISDPRGETDWKFGMAETGWPNGLGWFGEDCQFGDSGTLVCHNIGIDSTIRQVESCSRDDVADGATLFHAEVDTSLTYYLQDPLGNCWAWGHDPSFYSPLVCVEADF